MSDAKPFAPMTPASSDTKPRRLRSDSPSRARALSVIDLTDSPPPPKRQRLEPPPAPPAAAVDSAPLPEMTEDAFAVMSAAVEDMGDCEEAWALVGDALGRARVRPIRWKLAFLAAGGKAVIDGEWLCAAGSSLWVRC